MSSELGLKDRNTQEYLSVNRRQSAVQITGNQQKVNVDTELEQTDSETTIEEELNVKNTEQGQARIEPQCGMFLFIIKNYP